MAKWYGKIGYAETVEYEPGCCEDVITERSYYGDILRNRWDRQSSGDVNDNINLSHQISILADPYTTQHCSSMVYAELMGEKWKITDVEIQYPRLILSIGGVYNGEQARTTE